MTQDAKLIPELDARVLADVSFRQVRGYAKTVVREWSATPPWEMPPANLAGLGDAIAAAVWDMLQSNTAAPRPPTEDEIRQHVDRERARYSAR